MRSIEPLTAGARLVPAAKSCFSAFGCTPGHRKTVISLTADAETATARACAQGSGHRGTAPIVVLRQNVVSPSEAFVRWTRAELTKHANWIKAQLDDIHGQFVKLPASASISKAIAQLPTAWSILAARASHAGRHDLVVDPDPVLRFGSAQRLFWVSPRTYRSDHPALYRLPSTTELNQVNQWLRSIPNILGKVNLSTRQLATADKLAALQATDWPVLRALLSAYLRVPKELVSTDLLPSLQVVIAEQFDVHIYPIDSHRPNEYLLKLVNKHRKVPLPNIFSEQWEGAGVNGYYYSAEEHVWQALHQAATRDVLLADRLEEDKDGHWFAASRWLTAFGLGTSSSSAVAQERFKQCLHEIRRTSLWT